MTTRRPAPDAQIARGRFVTFEGGEGVGKSVQARRLSETLIARGLAVTLTREPGGTRGAEDIRALVVTGAAERWPARTETLLYAAARADHLDHLIRPKLAAGAWVVCDRFADSTLAYQSGGRGVDRVFVDSLNALVIGKDWPDLTLILDIDVNTGLARAKARATAQGSDEQRYEAFDHAFHERLRAAYRDIAAREPHRCVLIDASGSEETIAATIWSHVAARFSL